MVDATIKYIADTAMKMVECQEHTKLVQSALILLTLFAVLALAIVLSYIVIRIINK